MIRMLRVIGVGAGARGVAKVTQPVFASLIPSHVIDFGVVKQENTARILKYDTQAWIFLYTIAKLYKL